MKRFAANICTVLMAATLLVCSVTACTPKNKGSETPEDKPIKLAIIYDNDVHCYIEGYAQLATVRTQFKDKADYVATVSSGDYLSGGMVGAVSEGEYIVDIMNKVGYDVVTLGNHEFDYGMERLFTLTEKMEAEVVCANLVRYPSGERLYPAYHIVKYGDIKVAYLGLATTKSALVKVVTDGMGNILYSFMYGEAFYENAQRCIDQARAEGADYVIALSHLGDENSGGEHPNSLELIAKTTGLDAVIDGHDHHTIAERFVADKEGKQVLLTSSGSEFDNVGVVTIDHDGRLHSEVIHTVNVELDDDIRTLLVQINSYIEEEANRVIGRSEVLLTIYDEEGNRIVRTRESNIGNLCADAFRVLTSADVAMVNGGGVRSDIEVGEITINHIYDVMPFGDKVYTATMTGQQILDALEFAVSFLPREAGVFMQVSGMSFDINPNTPSPVKTVEEGDNIMFAGVGEGERRISNLKILDSQTLTMRDVDPAKEYTVASLDYLILEQGGDGVLRYSTPKEYYFSDLECVSRYIQESLKGVVGERYATTEGRIRYINN